MAEAVLFNLATDILKLAGSITYSKSGLVCGVRDELDNLKGTVETIKDVLLDAEKKRWHSIQVENWLRKLKDVLYDVQDLLDDVATEDLKWEVTPGNKKAVSIFFSKSNQLAHRLKVANDIQKLWKRLDKIKKDRDFHLTEYQREEPMAFVTGKKPENLSPDREIIGREEDKKEIKQHLFASSPSQRVSFVAIVGKGGLGKTALARLVYNDREVKEHFGPNKMWVCVSDVFDVNKIIKQILKSAGCSDLDNKPEDQLRSLLDETLSGKKYLLVLDDLWNEDREKWVNLGQWLMCGSQGSKILITTRNRRDAEITDINSVIYEPRGLSDDKSWDLFRKMAFGDGVGLLDPELERLGQDIVKKCTGVPLAIRTVGSLLYNRKRDEWLRYKVNDFPEIQEIDEANEGIMKVLQFSYDKLPSSLKHCFAYCSLFPKDYVYKKDMMIHLWVAQGFIESRKGKDLEEVADDYFSELLSRSFLEVDLTIKYGDVRKVEEFKVHDLMHDLAQKVARGECKTVNSEGDNDIGIRHVSYILGTFSEERMMSLLGASKLRTFLLKSEWHVRNSSELDYNKVFSSCGHCRALYLEYKNIPLPPSSLGKLKQLRFLHISTNESIQSLPDSITDLVNLQTLELSFCMQLQTFPRDLRKLVKLRHLLIVGCDLLSHLPPLSELPSLRTLSLKFLKALKFVQQTSDPEPSNTTLPFFQSLESLNLSYCKKLEGGWGRMREMGAHQEHRLDNSWSSFPKLRFVEICKCPHLNSIPSFPKVEYLSIDGTKMLEQQLMANPNCPSEGTVEATFIPFPELKYLKFNPEVSLEPFMLKRLLQSASSLKYMSIYNFDLVSLSCEMQHLSFLQELYIEDCQGLDLSCQEDEHGTQWQYLKYLRVLTITNCSNLMALPEGIQHVTTLQYLNISSWLRLKCLPEWIGNFSLLEELELFDCPKLKYIPPEICNLTNLKELTIYDCPVLDRGCLADVHIPISDWDGGESEVLDPLFASDDDSSDSD